jgi:hypothetical protein
MRICEIILGVTSANFRTNFLQEPNGSGSVALVFSLVHFGIIILEFKFRRSSSVQKSHIAEFHKL